MAIIEKATTQDVIHVMVDNVREDEIKYSALVDTSDFGAGFYFFFWAVDDLQGGEIELRATHSDDTEGASFEEIPVENWVYKTPCVIDSLNVPGSNLAKQGYFGNKRYVKVKLIGNAAPLLDAEVFVEMVANPAVAATSQGRQI